MQPLENTETGRERRSLYRPVAIALVVLAILSASFVIMMIVSIGMAMRSIGNK